MKNNALALALAGVWLIGWFGLVLKFIQLFLFKI